MSASIEIEIPADADRKATPTIMEGLIVTPSVSTSISPPQSPTRILRQRSIPTVGAVTGTRTPTPTKETPPDANVTAQPLSPSHTASSATKSSSFFPSSSSPSSTHARTASVPIFNLPNSPLGPVPTPVPNASTIAERLAAIAAKKAALQQVGGAESARSGGSIPSPSMRPMSPMSPKSPLNRVSPSTLPPLSPTVGAQRPTHKHSSSFGFNFNQPGGIPLTPIKWNETEQERKQRIAKREDEDLAFLLQSSAGSLFENKHVKRMTANLADLQQMDLALKRKVSVAEQAERMKLRRSAVAGIDVAKITEDADAKAAAAAASSSVAAESTTAVPVAASLAPISSPGDSPTENIKIISDDEGDAKSGEEDTSTEESSDSEGERTRKVLKRQKFRAKKAERDARLAEIFEKAERMKQQEKMQRKRTHQIGGDSSAEEDEDASKGGASSDADTNRSSRRRSRGGEGWLHAAMLHKQLNATETEEEKAAIEESIREAKRIAREEEERERAAALAAAVAGEHGDDEVEEDEVTEEAVTNAAGETTIQKKVTKRLVKRDLAKKKSRRGTATRRKNLSTDLTDTFAPPPAVSSAVAATAKTSHTTSHTTTTPSRRRSGANQLSNSRRASARSDEMESVTSAVIKPVAKSTVTVSPTASKRASGGPLPVVTTTKAHHQKAASVDTTTTTTTGKSTPTSSPGTLQKRAARRQTGPVKGNVAEQLRQQTKDEDELIKPQVAETSKGEIKESKTILVTEIKSIENLPAAVATTPPLRAASTPRKLPPLPTSNLTPKPAIKSILRSNTPDAANKDNHHQAEHVHSHRPPVHFQSESGGELDKEGLPKVIVQVFEQPIGDARANNNDELDDPDLQEDVDQDEKKGDEEEEQFEVYDPDEDIPPQFSDDGEEYVSDDGLSSGRGGNGDIDPSFSVAITSPTQRAASLANELGVDVLVYSSEEPSTQSSRQTSRPASRPTSRPASAALKQRLFEPPADFPGVPEPMPRFENSLDESKVQRRGHSKQNSSTSTIAELNSNNRNDHHQQQSLMPYSSQELQFDDSNVDPFLSSSQLHTPLHPVAQKYLEYDGPPSDPTYLTPERVSSVTKPKPGRMNYFRRTPSNSRLKPVATTLMHPSVRLEAAEAEPERLGFGSSAKQRPKSTFSKNGGRGLKTKESFENDAFSVRSSLSPSGRSARRIYGRSASAKSLYETREATLPSGRSSSRSPQRVRLADGTLSPPWSLTSARDQTNVPAEGLPFQKAYFHVGNLDRLPTTLKPKSAKLVQKVQKLNGFTPNINMDELFTNGKSVELIDYDVHDIETTRRKIRAMASRSGRKLDSSASVPDLSRLMTSGMLPPGVEPSHPVELYSHDKIGSLFRAPSTEPPEVYKPRNLFEHAVAGAPQASHTTTPRVSSSRPSTAAANKRTVARSFSEATLPPSSVKPTSYFLEDLPPPQMIPAPIPPVDPTLHAQVFDEFQPVDSTPPTLATSSSAPVLHPHRVVKLPKSLQMKTQQTRRVQDPQDKVVLAQVIKRAQLANAKAEREAAARFRKNPNHFVDGSKNTWLERIQLEAELVTREKIEAAYQASQAALLQTLVAPPRERILKQRRAIQQPEEKENVNEVPGIPGHIYAGPIPIPNKTFLTPSTPPSTNSPQISPVVSPPSAPIASLLLEATPLSPERNLAKATRSGVTFGGVDPVFEQTNSIHEQTTASTSSIITPTRAASSTTTVASPPTPVTPVHDWANSILAAVSDTSFAATHHSRDPQLIWRQAQAEFGAKREASSQNGPEASSYFRTPVDVPVDELISHVRDINPILKIGSPQRSEYAKKLEADKYAQSVAHKKKIIELTPPEDAWIPQVFPKKVRSTLSTTTTKP